MYLFKTGFNVEIADPCVLCVSEESFELLSFNAGRRSCCLVWMWRRFQESFTNTSKDKLLKRKKRLVDNNNNKGKTKITVEKVLEWS